jgi:hypothetical protein
MIRSRLLPALLALALVLAGGARVWAQALSVEVIEPRSATAESLVPILAPLTPAPGSVQAFQGRLVVRGTPAAIAEIRALLAELDQPARNLVISVRHGTSVDQRLDRAEAFARHRSGTSGSVTSGGARILSTRSGRDERDHQRLRVLEGVPAFVSTGVDVPVGERSVVIGPGGAAVQDSVRYVSADSGFYVRARVIGDRARVEISAERTRLAPGHGGAFESSRAHTTVTAALGEWIEIGGNVEHAERDDTRILAQTRGSGRANRQVFLRVDLAE